MPRIFGYDLPEEQAVATVQEVFRSPIRFLDTASGCSDGESERRIGLAIREHDGLPSGFVLACKADRDPVTGDFSGGQVRRCLERSLTLLGLDTTPLYYLHDPEHEGFETTMAPGGAVEALLALKEEGLIGHMSPSSRGSGSGQARAPREGYEVFAPPRCLLALLCDAAPADRLIPGGDV